MYKISNRDIGFYIENIPGVVVINMQGIVKYVNQQCADYFGWKKDLILDKHILEVFPESKMIDGLKETSRK